jgi:cation diffusion facilitator CzcD-associated flavoprotein CzcO
MAEQREHSSQPPQMPPPPGDADGYEGPATLTIGGTRLDVRVRLRGHFQPIDGRYHWYGRIARHDGLARRLSAGRAPATLATGHGSAPCLVSDPDPWQRFRVTGVSTPPFPTVMTAPLANAPAIADLAGGEAAAGATAREAGASGHEQPAGGPAARQAARALPRHVRVAIIGAGFGGLGAGIRLARAGRADFVILERAGSVGGTWRDNTYPGCACDVPSHLYSFSFAPNPDWSHTFSRQPEIRQYLEDVADRSGIRGRIRFGTEVTGARWDAARALWQVRTSRGELTADVLISAAGPLSEPSIPDIPGLAEFPGAVFHSARWDHGYDLAGKRVAVIGTGASAIQLVPQIQPLAAMLVLFQRTPAWVLPRRDRRITGAERWLYQHVPLAQRLARLGIYLSRESTVGAFTRRPHLLRAAQRLALRNLAASISDPGLRAKLTPRYIMGCKRILLSSDYYPALARPNVEVVASGLARVDGPAVIAQDGTAHEVDAIIFATGFHTTDMPIAERILGADGRSLAEAWGADMRALRGTTVTGFPNLCLVIGPNTGLGHNSMVHIIESQLNYILGYLAALDESGAAALDARPGAQERWCAAIERRMGRTVWATGGCVSWYLNAAGRNPTLWPASTLRFRHETRRFDPAEYDFIPASAPAPAAVPAPGSGTAHPLAGEPA